MSHATEKAQALLNGIADAVPLKVNEITTPKDEVVIATIRKDDGYPFLLPHPEAQSMLTGARPYFEYVQQAAGIIEELLAEIEASNSSAKSNVEASKPETPSPRGGGAVSLPE